MVFGAANGENAAFDCDGEATLTGGSILSIGMSAMAQYPDGVTVEYSGVPVRAGMTVTIKDAYKNTVATVEAVKTADSVIFTSDSLTSGEVYTLYLDGTAVLRATAK